MSVKNVRSIEDNSGSDQSRTVPDVLNKFEGREGLIMPTNESAVIARQLWNSCKICKKVLCSVL